MKSIDILGWMRSKSFPYPLRKATLFEWYNHPEHIAEERGLPIQDILCFSRDEKEHPGLVVDPFHVAIHVEVDGLIGKLNNDPDIVQWVMDNIPMAKDVGVYDDRSYNGNVVLDVYASWAELDDLNGEYIVEAI